MSRKMVVGFNPGYIGEKTKEVLDCEEYGFLDWDDVKDEEKYDIAMEFCVNNGLEVFYYDED